MDKAASDAKKGLKVEVTGIRIDTVDEWVIAIIDFTIPGQLDDHEEATVRKVAAMILDSAKYKGFADKHRQKTVWADENGSDETRVRKSVFLPAEPESFNEWNFWYDKAKDVTIGSISGSHR